MQLLPFALWGTARFTDNVKIKGITVMGEPGSKHPSRMAAFINREDVDFDNVRAWVCVRACACESVCASACHTHTHIHTHTLSLLTSLSLS